MSNNRNRGGSRAGRRGCGRRRQQTLEEEGERDRGGGGVAGEAQVDGERGRGGRGRGGRGRGGRGVEGSGRERGGASRTGEARRSKQYFAHQKRLCESVGTQSPCMQYDKHFFYGDALSCILEGKLLMASFRSAKNCGFNIAFATPVKMSSYSKLEEWIARLHERMKRQSPTELLEYTRLYRNKFHFEVCSHTCVNESCRNLDAIKRITTTGDDEVHCEDVCRSLSEDVLIKGRKNQNRAMHGDIVALHILPELEVDTEEPYGESEHESQDGVVIKVAEDDKAGNGIIVRDCLRTAKYRERRLGTVVSIIPSSVASSISSSLPPPPSLLSSLELQSMQKSSIESNEKEEMEDHVNLHDALLNDLKTLYPIIGTEEKSFWTSISSRIPHIWYDSVLKKNRRAGFSVRDAQSHVLFACPLKSCFPPLLVQADDVTSVLRYSSHDGRREHRLNVFKQEYDEWTGKLFLVRLKSWTETSSLPTGEVLSYLGRTTITDESMPSSPPFLRQFLRSGGTCIDMEFLETVCLEVSNLAANALPFSPTTLKEVDQILEETRKSYDEECKRRVDFRMANGVNILTIDPESARDLDDAIHIKLAGYQYHFHLADSHDGEGTDVDSDGNIDGSHDYNDSEDHKGDSGGDDEIDGDLARPTHLPSLCIEYQGEIEERNENDNPKRCDLEDSSVKAPSAPFSHACISPPIISMRPPPHLLSNWDRYGFHRRYRDNYGADMDFERIKSEKWKKKRVKIYEIGVHIADVSHFVKSDGLVDEEAKNRSQSLYFPSDCFPMLPRALCEELCSLKPDDAKLAVSVVFYVCEDDGGLADGFDVHFCESVVESKCQLSYQQVQTLYDHSSSLSESRADRSAQIPPSVSLTPTSSPSRSMLSSPSSLLPQSLEKSLLILLQLTRKMRKRNLDNGAVELGSSKLIFQLDKESKIPVSFHGEERNDANRLIEQLMLMGNRLVAILLAGAPLSYDPCEKKSLSVADANLIDEIDHVYRPGYNSGIDDKGSDKKQMCIRETPLRTCSSRTLLPSFARFAVLRRHPPPLKDGLYRLRQKLRQLHSPLLCGSSESSFASKILCKAEDLGGECLRGFIDSLLAKNLTGAAYTVLGYETEKFTCVDENSSDINDVHSSARGTFSSRVNGSINREDELLEFRDGCGEKDKYESNDEFSKSTDCQTHSCPGRSCTKSSSSSFTPSPPSTNAFSEARGHLWLPAVLAKRFHHFALSFHLYTHFTSPIRRYADILVHRLLKYFIGRTTRGYKGEDMWGVGEGMGDGTMLTEERQAVYSMIGSNLWSDHKKELHDSASDKIQESVNEGRFDVNPFQSLSSSHHQSGSQEQDDVDRDKHRHFLSLAVQELQQRCDLCNSLKSASRQLSIFSESLLLALYLMFQKNRSMETMGMITGINERRVSVWLPEISRVVEIPLKRSESSRPFSAASIVRPLWAPDVVEDFEYHQNGTHRDHLMTGDICDKRGRENATGCIRKGPMVVLTYYRSVISDIPPVQVFLRRSEKSNAGAGSTSPSEELSLHRYIGVWCKMLLKTLSLIPVRLSVDEEAVNDLKCFFLNPFDENFCDQYGKRNVSFDEKFLDKRVREVSLESREAFVREIAKKVPTEVQICFEASPSSSSSLFASSKSSWQTPSQPSEGNSLACLIRRLVSLSTSPTFPTDTCDREDKTENPSSRGELYMGYSTRLSICETGCQPARIRIDSFRKVSSYGGGFPASDKYGGEPISGSVDTVVRVGLDLHGNSGSFFDALSFKSRSVEVTSWFPEMDLLIEPPTCIDIKGSA